MRSGTLGLILVGAGSGERMGGIDKVWTSLAEHPVVWYPLTQLAPLARRTVLVLRPDQIPLASKLEEVPQRFEVVPGGITRQESVSKGLEVVNDVDMIAVHDVARPLATPQLLQKGLQVLESCDGAIPLETLPDTIKQVDDNENILTTVSRTSLRIAQTPQVFRTSALLSAHEQAGRLRQTGTDDAELLEHAGYRVKGFPGSKTNFKITTPQDLRIARLLVQEGLGS